MKEININKYVKNTKSMLEVFFVIYILIFFKNAILADNLITIINLKFGNKLIDELIFNEKSDYNSDDEYFKESLASNFKNYFNTYTSFLNSIGNLPSYNIKYSLDFNFNYFNGLEIIFFSLILVYFIYNKSRKKVANLSII